MAVAVTINCRVCGEQKRESRSDRDWEQVCDSCRRDEAAQKRAAHLKDLEALSVEERLAKIEQWIYDYKPRVNPFDVTFG